MIFLTAEELEVLQEYQEADNQSIGYEGNIAKTQLKKVADWLRGDCEHDPPNPKSKIFRKGLPRFQCNECMKELLKEIE